MMMKRDINSAGNASKALLGKLSGASKFSKVEDNSGKKDFLSKFTSNTKASDTSNSLKKETNAEAIHVNRKNRNILKNIEDNSELTAITSKSNYTDLPLTGAFKKDQVKGTKSEIKR